MRSQFRDNLCRTAFSPARSHQNRLRIPILDRDDSAQDNLQRPSASRDRATRLGPAAHANVKHVDTGRPTHEFAPRGQIGCTPNRRYESRSCAFDRLDDFQSAYGKSDAHRTQHGHNGRGRSYSATRSGAHAKSRYRTDDAARFRPSHPDAS